MITTCDGNGEVMGCGAPIEWVVVEKSGRRMPIDAMPVDDGNIVKVGRELQDRTPLVAYLHSGRTEQQSLLDDGQLRFVSHFATCSNADAFRRQKGK